MQKCTKIFSALALILVQIGIYAVEEQPSPEKALQQMRNMMKNIVIDNQEFRNDPLHDEDYFRRHAEGQWPRMTVVACADSRVHTSNFDFHPLGDVFFIRNIGNQIETCPGSIEYGVRHLHTPLLLFLGHSQCGAVKAVTQGTDALEESIRRELEPMCLKHQTPSPTKEQIAENVIHNVHNQVNKAYDQYQELVSQGLLWVVGAVYDFTPEGRGAFHVIQVNDQTDESSISAFLEDVERYGDYYNDPGRETEE